MENTNEAIIKMKYNPELDNVLKDMSFEQLEEAKDFLENRINVNSDKLIKQYKNDSSLFTTQTSLIGMGMLLALASVPATGVLKTAASVLALASSSIGLGISLYRLISSKKNHSNSRMLRYLKSKVEDEMNQRQLEGEL